MESSAIVTELKIESGLGRRLEQRLTWGVHAEAGTRSDAAVTWKEFGEGA